MEEMEIGESERMSATQAQHLVALIQTIRPRWNDVAINNALRVHWKTRPAGQIMLAALHAATDPGALTPKAISHDKAWNHATGYWERKAKGEVKAPESNDIDCPRHPGTLHHKCEVCLEGSPIPDLPETEQLRRTMAQYRKNRPRNARNPTTGTQ